MGDEKKIVKKLAQLSLDDPMEIDTATTTTPSSASFSLPLSTAAAAGAQEKYDFGYQTVSREDIKIVRGLFIDALAETINRDQRKHSCVINERPYSELHAKQTKQGLSDFYFTLQLDSDGRYAKVQVNTLFAGAVNYTCSRIRPIIVDGKASSGLADMVKTFAGQLFAQWAQKIRVKSFCISVEFAEVSMNLSDREMFMECYVRADYTVNHTKTQTTAGSAVQTPSVSPDSNNSAKPVIHDCKTCNVSDHIPLVVSYLLKTFAAAIKGYGKIGSVTHCHWSGFMISHEINRSQTLQELTKCYNLSHGGVSRVLPCPVTVDGKMSPQLGKELDLMVIELLGPCFKMITTENEVRYNVSIGQVEICRLRDSDQVKLSLYMIVKYFPATDMSSWV